MGAGDDGHPKPSEGFPCDGGAGNPHLKGIGGTKHLPSVPAQVDASSSYAVAGKLLLAASGAFAGILLALIVLHMCRSSRREHFRGRQRLLRSLAITGDQDRDSGAAPSPRGLDPAVLRALPVVPAGAGAGDCAVCLAEFEHGDKARALPRCGHRFHVECIDAWFRENSTCPLCRADVEAPADAEAQARGQSEVRIDVAVDGDAAAAAKSGEPAIGRLPSCTDLEKKSRRVDYGPTRSASF